MYIITIIESFLKMNIEHTSIYHHCEMKQTRDREKRWIFWYTWIHFSRKFTV